MNPILPPENLIFEIPFPGNEACPVQCAHCIHRNPPPSSKPKLVREQIADLIVQASKLGTASLSIYPHQGEVALAEFSEMSDYFRLAHQVGLRVKTVTSGISVKNTERLLPLVDKLAVSVDALDWETYRAFRSRANYDGMRATLELLKEYRQQRSELMLVALVMVSAQTLYNIEERVERIAGLGIFNKIKVLEMLPLGGAKLLASQALDRQDSMARLARLRKQFQRANVQIGVPMWRVKNNQRGCRLGSKDLVVGPHGELAGCALLFYLNVTLGNVVETTLEEAWQARFQLLREKENRHVLPICRTCPFYQNDLCWGGCWARNMIFGQATELARSCGVRQPEDAQRLYARYLESQANGTPVFHPFDAQDG